MLAQGKSLWTGDFESRVEFVQHDYFKPQPVHNATAFFTRQITHNLTDEDVVRFFSAFVPALEVSKPGTPLLINDTVIPEPDEKTAYEEHGLRQVDLAMWIVFNSKQRTEVEFKKLLARADARLRVRMTVKTDEDFKSANFVNSLSRYIARGAWACSRCSWITKARSRTVVPSFSSFYNTRLF